MKNNIAMKVTDLHKEFILPQHKNTSLKHAFVNIVKQNGKVTQKVLDGVSFEVNEGDFFGIVGRNGSGKSTLLKMLAGVYTPTAGGIEMNGSLTPFIELGVGFNPELSGRDNVFLNGALLGFTRKQMADMYEDIVDFAELGPFMDQKLKNYSSGMQVRLAFSIAIKAKNEILIFDEVLAVGDEAFQKKCINVFEQYKANKQTVILVTHEMETVKRFCTKAMLLNNGKIEVIGSPFEVAERYSELNNQSLKEESEKKEDIRKKSYEVDITFTDTEGKKQAQFDYNDTVAVDISWPNNLGIEHANILIFKKTGEYAFGTSTFDQEGFKPSKDGVRFQFQAELGHGDYRVEVGVFGKSRNEMIDYVAEGPTFSIRQPKVVRWSGLTNLKHIWRSKQD